MHRCLLWRVALWSVGLTTPLCAQAWEPSGEPLIALDARAGAGGHIEYWPNPAAGGAVDRDTGPWFAPFQGRLLVGPNFSLDQLGHSFGDGALAAALIQGSVDLASAGSIRHRWRGLAIAPDLPELLALLRTRPAIDDLAGQLHRLAALRWAEEGAVVEVAPVLTLLVRDATEDEHARVAAAQALATLRNRRHEHAPELPPLASALVEMPADCDWLLVVRHARLPRLPRLPLVARDLAQRDLARQIRLAGGAISPEQLAGGQWLADLAPVFPYELALHLGNLRLDRSVLGAVVSGGAAPPDFIFVADGRFDRAQIGVALAPGVAAKKDHAGTTTIEVARGRRVEVSATRLLVHWRRWFLAGGGPAPAPPVVPEDALVWLRGRFPAAAPKFLSKLEGARMRVSLVAIEGGHRLRAEIDSPAAVTLFAPQALRARLPKDLPPATAAALPKLLEAMTVTASATGASVELTDAGLGLEDAVAHVLELLYAWSSLE